jgi:hypothetical protein
LPAYASSQTSRLGDKEGFTPRDARMSSAVRATTGRGLSLGRGREQGAIWACCPMVGDSWCWLAARGSEARVRWHHARHLPSQGKAGWNKKAAASNPSPDYLSSRPGCLTGRTASPRHSPAPGAHLTLASPCAHCRQLHPKSPRFYEHPESPTKPSSFVNPSHRESTCLHTTASTNICARARTHTHTHTHTHINTNTHKHICARTCHRGPTGHKPQHPPCRC